MNGAVAYLIARMAEPSSWRGAVALATAAGVTLTPELQNAVISAGLGLIGLIGVLTKDKH